MNHTHTAAEPGRVTGFWHTSVSVREMDEALRFYRDCLGLELETEYRLPGTIAAPIVGVPVEELHSVFLKFPGSEARLELHEYRGIERHSASARPCDFGTGHFCVYVDDADAVYARLVAAGYRARGPVITVGEGPRAGAKVVYTISPEGYHVELYQPPAAR